MENVYVQLSGAPRLPNRICSEHLVVSRIGRKEKIQETQHTRFKTSDVETEGTRVVPSRDVVPITDAATINILCAQFKM